MNNLLPEIPSDNLYKFFAFAGLIMTLFFTIYPIQLEGDLKVTYYNALCNTQILEMKSKAHKEEYKALAKRSQELVDQKGSQRHNLHNMQESIVNGSVSNLYREQQEFLNEYLPAKADIYYFKFPQELKEIEKDLRKKTLELDILRRQIDKETNILETKENSLTASVL